MTTYAQEAQTAAKSSDVTMFVDRMSKVWRRLRWEDGYREEITRSVMNRLRELDASDFNPAFDELLKSSKVVAWDGGPAEPPAPNAVVGMLLLARKRRLERGPRKEPPTGTRRLRAYPCPTCAGPRDYIIGTPGFIYCQPCNRASLRQPHDELEFADPPAPTDAEVKAIKAKVARLTGKDISDG